jgi:Spy/CpxP family protein refolding chaperone
MFRTNQEKMDAWIANRKFDRKEMTACHDEMEASIKKMGSYS